MFNFIIGCIDMGIGCIDNGFISFPRIRFCLFLPSFHMTYGLLVLSLITAMELLSLVMMVGCIWFQLSPRSVDDECHAHPFPLMSLDSECSVSPSHHSDGWMSFCSCSPMCPAVLQSLVLVLFIIWP